MSCTFGDEMLVRMRLRRAKCVLGGGGVVVVGK
jgi:hypothetical protein